MLKHTLAGLALCAAVQASAVLNIYPAGNPAMPHNDDYTVKVRTVGGEWRNLYEYNVQVDMDRVQDATMVQFDMDEPVEVFVKKNNGDFSTVDIRPLHDGIKYERGRNWIEFRLDSPRYLSVEFDGDRLHNLHLFANPVESEVYTESSEGVMYFGPGVHRPGDIPNNLIRIPSNTTVYLAPGAVVKAKLLVADAENVRILGRGILDHPLRGVEVTDSKNVEIDGITVVNPDHYTVFGGGADGLKIRNLKTFSTKPWSDGIDLMCCNHVDIDNVFVRTSDDCLAFYNHRWLWKGGSTDFTVRRAVLWADVAHTINIGGHGDHDNADGEVAGNMHFSDIDILEHDEDDPDYCGAMAIVVGDNNIARNIVFEDIRVESIQEGALFHLEVMFNAKYNKMPGKKIENITFRNISYTGCGEYRPVLKGYSAERNIDGVLLENVTVNGRRLDSINLFDHNEFIKNIRFK